MSRERLAYDRSMRHFDQDGRLHVALTPLTKANICPYRGNEINVVDGTKLDPNRIYYLLRDPDELALAATTSNNIQLLHRHTSDNDGTLTANNPLPLMVVGSTGTDATYSNPYLMNSLVVWDKEAIAFIENNQKRELSCSYRYDGYMTPGTYLGGAYDGVMRNIRFNHVALVPQGRAGADILVADAKPLELLAYDSMPFDISGEDPHMNKTPATSPRALVARGVLAAFLQPRLAKDAAIDYRAILNGTTSRNWDQAKPVIVANVHAACRGKLAADASLEGLLLALDAVDKDDEDEVMDKKAKDEDDDDDDDEDEKKKKEMKDKKARDKKAKDEEEVVAAKEKKEDDDDKKAAKDEEDDDEKKKDDDDKGKDKKANDKTMPTVTKHAMDAAIKEAVATQHQQMLDHFRELREAEDLVRPVVGNLLAQDSAEDVYKYLFRQEKVWDRYKDVHPSAYRALAQTLIEGKQRAQKAPDNSRPQRMAHDAVLDNELAKKYPNFASVRVRH